MPKFAIAVNIHLFNNRKSTQLVR